MHAAQALPARGARLQALSWMTGALFGFLMMGISARELSAEVSLYQLLVYRNLICLVFVLAILTRIGFKVARTKFPARHIARNTVHLAGQFLWFVAIVSIPLTEVFAIEFTTPIWTALLAVLFLGERLTPVRALSVVLAFTGVMLILRPGSAIVNPAALAAIAAAMCFAVTFAITKNMVGYERPMTILFWMHLIQLPLGLVPALATGWVNPSPTLWHWVAIIGIAGFATHYCVARALILADAIVVIPLDFLRLPIGALVGWMFYAESPDAMVLLGAGIIVIANWSNLRYG